MSGTKKIAIAGLGKMGSAIARAALAAGYDVHGYDSDNTVLPSFADALTDAERSCFHAAAGFNDLLNEKIPLVLAVKPAQIKPLTTAVPDDRLIISIAAGISLHEITNNRLVAGPVIRAMPNTPLIVGKGMTVLCASGNCREEDINFAISFFSLGGDCFFLEDEKLMHVVTGLSGSGPAYAYLFIQALEDAGVMGGLPRQLARRLAVQTVAGAAEMCRSSNRTPQDLIHDVTSPGGTTIAALAVLKEKKFEAIVQKAVTAAAERSKLISG